MKVQMKDNRRVFSDFSARPNAIVTLIGIDSNIRQATAHKPIELFFKFIVVLFPGNTARSRCTFLAMVNNLKMTNPNGGRNNAMKIIANVPGEKTKPFLTIK